MIRHAYTLIELLVALASSTLIIIGLASTIAISTELLESPTNDDDLWRNREISERLAADLRYATHIQDDVNYGFQITRPDPETGADQTVTYQSYSNGLTRQVTGIPTMVLDSEAPSLQRQVDGYSAATTGTNDQFVRVRSTSAAASDDAVSSLLIDTPEGCKPNDFLLLCVSAKTPDNISVSESGWQTLYNLSRDDLRMSIKYRFYDAAYPATSTINADIDSAMCAVLMAIENVGTYSSPPITWSNSDSGYGIPTWDGSKPSPLEDSSYTAYELNLQIVAAEHHPWLDGTIGLASFVDVAQATAAPGTHSIRSSIAVAVRNDHSPSLSATPRVYYDSFGDWLQAGIKLEATQ